MHTLPKTINQREGNQEQQRPTQRDFAEMVMPGMGEKQRTQSNGKQDKGKGDTPRKTQIRTVKIGGTGGSGQHEKQWQKFFKLHCISLIVLFFKSKGSLKTHSGCAAEARL